MRSYRSAFCLYVLTCALLLVFFPATSNSIAQEVGGSIFVINADGVSGETVESGEQVELPHGKLYSIAESAPNRYVVWHRGEAVLVGNQDVMLPEEVLEYVDKRLKENPNAVDYALKTRVLFNLTRYDEALQASEKALELDSENVKALQYRASVAYFSGDRDETIRLHEELLDLAEDHYLTHAIGFYISTSGGDWHSGRESLQRAVELEPYSAALWANLGFAHRRLGDNDKADECFEKAIQVDPASTSGYYFRGIYAYTDGDLKVAIPNLEKCVELNDNKTGAYMALSEVADEKGDHRRYRKLIVKATTCRDANALMKREAAWELATSPIEDRRDGKTALKLATELVDSGETEPELVVAYLKAKAAAQAEVGQFMDALETLDLINPDSRHGQFEEMKSLFEDKQKFRLTDPDYDM